MDILNSSPARPAVPQTGFGQVQQPSAFGGLNMSGMGGMGGIGAPIHRSTPSMSSQPPQYSTPLQPQNFFGSGATPLSPTNASFTSASTRPGTTPVAQTKSTPVASANFDDLWSLSLGTGATKSPSANSGTGKSIKDLEREKAMAGLWGGQKPTGGLNSGTGPGANANAFGSFGNSSSGGDDLLL